MISVQPNHPNHVFAGSHRNTRTQTSSPAAQDPADLKLVQQLAARDREVRTHEQAHVSAAGGLAHGGAKFKFTTGPDGRQYATSGEVSIDVSPVPNDPEATIEKAQKISRAALAPANPSQADRAVAARANALAIEAKVEIQRAVHEETKHENANAEPFQASPKNPYEQTHSTSSSFVDLLV